MARQETTTRTLYTFGELSEKAKAAALDKHRNWNVEGLEWWEFVYEDAARIGALMGFTGMRISFSGFWSQGSGARFDAAYSFAPDVCRRVKAYAPKDSTLHNLAARLMALQKANGRKLEGSCARVGGGMAYEHSGWMNCEITRTDEREVSAEDEKEFTAISRGFADWIYRTLEKDYEGQTSDEAVAAILEDREFTEDGVLV